MTTKERILERLEFCQVSYERLGKDRWAHAEQKKTFRIYAEVCAAAIKIVTEEFAKEGE